ncbi:hypothetical protein OG809_33680 [Kribbella soli]
MLKLGGLALQTIDFREQHGHVFGLDRLCRADPFPASPVVEAAEIRAEALVGPGRGVGVGALLADVLAGGQIVSERGW